MQSKSYSSGILSKGKAEEPFIKRDVWECIQFMSFSINELSHLLCLSFYVSTDVLYAQKKQTERKLNHSKLYHIYLICISTYRTNIKGWHKRGNLNVIVEQDTLEASPLNWQLAGSKPQGYGFVQVALAVMCLCH